ncbi:hypothetical protein GOP47_0002276 [Adiantum capillus-veneris]|uniref:Uncharacterized protein n=1 Tax=Adiantum capillus-veneris TaxID=13818 RepID=A0A9D4VBF6_ADICA|nr:hypothetical protein GOP47_0002276 [Adiantum capillus-veneris]
MLATLGVDVRFAGILAQPGSKIDSFQKRFLWTSIEIVLRSKVQGLCAILSAGIDSVVKAELYHDLVRKLSKEVEAFVDEVFMEVDDFIVRFVKGNQELVADTGSTWEVKRLTETIDWDLRLRKYSSSKFLALQVRGEVDDTIWVNVTAEDAIEDMVVQKAELPLKRSPTI